MALGKEGTSILILVDDIRGGMVDVRELAATYQELVGERLDVAFVLAGQPDSVSAVLNDPMLSFLSRATRIQLGPSTTREIDT